MYGIAQAHSDIAKQRYRGIRQTDGHVRADALADSKGCDGGADGYDDARAVGGGHDAGIGSSG